MRYVRRFLFSIIDLLLPDAGKVNILRGSIARVLLGLSGAEHLSLGRGVRFGRGFEDFNVGSRVRIGSNCYFYLDGGSPVTIGDNTYIGSWCIFRTFERSPITIGSDSYINIYCTFEGNWNAPITIGSHVEIAAYGVVWTSTHEVGYSERRAGKGKSSPISIGDGSWIGLRSTILADVGAGCVVSSGSTVSTPLPANTLVSPGPTRAVPGAKLPVEAIAEIAEPASAAS